MKIIGIVSHADQMRRWIRNDDGKITEIVIEIGNKNEMVYIPIRVKEEQISVVDKGDQESDITQNKEVSEKNRY